MKNHWLDEEYKTRMIQEIHAVAVETWVSESLFSDFWLNLTDEQQQFFMSMKFASPNIDDDGLGLNLIKG